MPTRSQAVRGLRRVLYYGALLHPLVSSGCRGASRNREKGRVEPAASASVIETSRMVAEPPVVLRLRLPRESRTGASVPLQLEVENTSGDSITLHLPGREAPCRFEVRSPGGRLVWPLPRPPQLIELPAELKSLGPNSRFVCEDAWSAADQGRAGVTPGLYAVVGVLRTSPELATPAAEVLIRE